MSSNICAYVSNWVVVVRVLIASGRVQRNETKAAGDVHVNKRAEPGCVIPVERPFLSLRSKNDNQYCSPATKLLTIGNWRAGESTRLRLYADVLLLCPDSWLTDRSQDIGNAPLPATIPRFDRTAVQRIQQLQTCVSACLVGKDSLDSAMSWFDDAHLEHVLPPPSDLGRRYRCRQRLTS